MEILIYIVIPCVGSVFLLGGMFYGAYRMSGYAGLPGREDRLPAEGRIAAERRARTGGDGPSEGHIAAKGHGRGEEDVLA